jgi:hypothetical protein
MSPLGCLGHLQDRRAASLELPHGIDQDKDAGSARACACAGISAATKWAFGIYTPGRRWMTASIGTGRPLPFFVAIDGVRAIDVTFRLVFRGFSFTWRTKPSSIRFLTSKSDEAWTNPDGLGWVRLHGGAASSRLHPGRPLRCDPVDHGLRVHDRPRGRLAR